MKYKLKLVSAACLASSMVANVQAEPLRKEIELLLTTHPLISASESGIAGAKERLAAAKGVLLPTLSVSANAGREDITSQSYLPNADFELGRAGLGPAQSSDFQYTKYSVNLDMPLWHGGRNHARIRSSLIDYYLQEDNLNAIEQDLLLEGITAYLQVARFQTLIKLAEQNERATQNQLELERKRVEAGGGVDVDAMQAQTRLQIVRERKVFYRQGLRDVLANYQQVFGRQPNLSTMQSLEIYDRAIPRTLSEAIVRVSQNSPRVSAANYSAEKAREAIAVAKSDMLPQVDLVMMKSEDVDKNMLAAREDFYAGIRVNWKFSLGLSQLNLTDSARASYNEQRQRAIDVRNRAEEQVRVAWNQIENGKERQELLEDAAAIAKAVMLDRKKLRDSGKETALSVLDAEVEYYGVLANRVNAIYDTRIYSYRLLAAIGQLTPEAMGLPGQFNLPVTALTIDIDEM